MRILLPPSLAGCVQRNAIPAKIELESKSKARLPPEKCQMEDLAGLEDSERSALFALSQWCGGKLSSFLQLNMEQTFELLKLLQNKPCFFPANSPESPIVWSNGELDGVSEYLTVSARKKTPSKVREIEEAKDSLVITKEETEPENYSGPPIEVEGSTEYLRIILPSSEHPGYSEVLRLLRHWNFIRDRSHRHWWWLRDKSKVLDFLANHKEDLELDYDAVFTENFRELTSSIQNAVLRVHATEENDQIKVESRIEAGNAPIEVIEHALATGPESSEAW